MPFMGVCGSPLFEAASIELAGATLVEASNEGEANFESGDEVKIARMAVLAIDDGDIEAHQNIGERAGMGLEV